MQNSLRCLQHEVKREKETERRKRDYMGGLDVGVVVKCFTHVMVAGAMN